MTITTALSQLPDFEAALETFMALCHEGYSVTEALTATWDEYEALIAQRAAFVRGERK